MHAHRYGRAGPRTAEAELPILKRLGSTPFVDPAKSRSTTDELIKRLAIKTASRGAAANSLSGGNQQKVVIGKWLATDPDILIMDESTAGIDIGSKGEVLRLVRALAAEGKSIIFISSELAELAAVSDRIAVMSDGRLVETVDKADLLSSTGDATELRAEQKLQLIVQRGGNHGRHICSGGPRDTVGLFKAHLAAEHHLYRLCRRVPVLALTLHDKGFLTPNNILNIARQTAMIAVMAMAMTLVLSSGEIDLSVGAVAGLASVTTAMAVAWGGLPAGIAAGIMTGVTVGLINGVLSTRLMIPTFLTTLAMMGIAKGTAMWISGTAAIPVLDRTYPAIFGGGSIGPIPTLLLWMLVIGVIGHIVLRHTKFGRQVLAVGGNVVAARYSGINTNRIKLWVIVISAVTASLAGMLYAGRLQTGRFQLGEGDELSVIAAVVLGGTSLFWWQGHGHRLDYRRPHDRCHQQRADPDGPRIFPATHRPRRHHHPHCRPQSGGHAIFLMHG
jgi:ribose transport system permease protein